jgi:class 3 adenylate cyclase/tetratricopeptide (TPR) repeat protein
MKCPKCQANNPDDAKFCIECGGAMEFHCPKCGSPTPARGRFCKECGCTLDEAKASTPSVDYSKPQSYTPKFLADKILSTGKSLEGERKLVTVLFADVAGYTSMSERLDSEEVRQIMDGCFKIIMDSVYRFEGTIDKFTGDGVMALFGAPLAHEDHAQRACYAALEMQRALKEYGVKVKEDCGFDFKIRVGLNSGPVIVGGVGNDLKMDYTAVGDTVNLASRMQTMAEPASVLIGTDTQRMVRDFFEFETLGKKPVKGKEEPVEAYRLLRASQVATRIEASMAKGLTRFVGREKEMAVLKEAFEKAKSGAGQVVGLVGEAGVGKSRLLLEFKRMLPEGECTFLGGRCLHYGSSMPYVPLLEILRAYFDIREGEREFLVKKKITENISRLDEKMKNTLPPLHDLFSLKVEEEGYLWLDPQKKRERIFDAIRDLFVRESQNKTLVLAVDDLQWIDRTSNEFLRYFINWLASSHIMLVLFYRPEYVHQWGSKSYYSQIRVEQLSTSASAALIRSMLEEGEVAPELKELILNRAAGNPLFMEEFTHTLLENGSIQKKGHQYVLSRKASDIQVPDTIQGIIAARMDRLEDNLKRTMQVASVIGRDFAFSILQTISGMQEDLKTYLMNLQGLEFIYEKSLFPELEYMFKHTLTQEVAYGSLLVKRRKELHEKIGQAIEELYPDKLEEFYEALAFHYAGSENWEKAYQYLLSSAMKAGTRYSLWEAFRLGKEALNVLSRMPETEANKRRGIDGRLLLALVIMILGYPENSLEILQEGERLSRELGDEKALARFHGYIGTYHAITGDSQESTKYLDDAFHTAEKAQDIELMAPIAFQLCLTCGQQGYILKVVEVAPKVIALLESTHRELEFLGFGAFNLYSALLASYGNALAWMGDFEEAQAQCDKALRFAANIKDVGSLGFVEYWYAWSHMLQGDAGKGIEHMQGAIRYLEEAQVVAVLGGAWTGLGYGYGLLGQTDVGLSHMKKGLEGDIALGNRLMVCFHHYHLAMLHLVSGDLQDAQGHAEKTVELAQAQHNTLWVANGLTVLGGVLGKTDRTRSAQAEEYILQALKRMDETKAKSMCAVAHLILGEFYVDTGQMQKALETLGTTQQMMQEMGMDYWLARTEKALEGLKAQ